MKRKKIYVFLPVEVEIYESKGDRSIAVGSFMNPTMREAQQAFDDGNYVSTSGGAKQVCKALHYIAEIFRSNPQVTEIEK